MTSVRDMYGSGQEEVKNKHDSALQVSMVWELLVHGSWFRRFFILGRVYGHGLY